MAAFVIIIIQCLVDFLMFLGGAYGFAGNTAKVDVFSLLWQSKAQNSYG